MSHPNPSLDDDYAYQTSILQGVSRTFALTIPTLPQDLERVVGNGYLLCRIADTIEDDSGIPLADKKAFADRFVAVVADKEAADVFATDLSPKLTSIASADEKDLIRNTPSVIRLTHSFNPTQRAALERCIRIMSDGMIYYQESESLDGLADQQAMDRYCYFVAGVVGEMLTELFCDYHAELSPKRDELMRLGVSFGQGLQMTNILKDIWDDRARGACWLPRALFKEHGLDLKRIDESRGSDAYGAAISDLIAIAHGHLRNALRYTLMIPSQETGIRKFCLWALGMAVMNLRKIHANPHFETGTDVKITRRTVKFTVASTSLAAAHDAILRALFALAAKPLPRRDEDLLLSDLSSSLANAARHPVSASAP